MVAKISISIPRELLTKIEKERLPTGKSRSEFFVQVVEAFLKKKREEEMVKQYIRGYELQPETEEELAWAEIGLGVFADNPWEKESSHE